MQRSSKSRAYRSSFDAHLNSSPPRLLDDEVVVRGEPDVPRLAEVAHPGVLLLVATADVTGAVGRGVSEMISSKSVKLWPSKASSDSATYFSPLYLGRPMESLGTVLIFRRPYALLRARTGWQRLWRNADHLRQGATFLLRVQKAYSARQHKSRP